MAKTEVEGKFDYLVSKVIWPHFKSLGYKKSGNNFRFYDETTGLGKIVNFQKSTYYNKEHIHFTINIGVFLNNEHLTWGRLLGNKFTEPCCVLRERIGDLMKINNIWFDLTSETDTIELNNDIEDMCIKYIIPYLSKYNSTHDVFHAIVDKSRNSINEIKALFYSGYIKEALTILGREIDGAKNEHFLQNLLSTRKDFENIKY